MGIVYEAEQHGTRDFVKRVAIKVIRQSYANQKTFIENFIGEAKLVADLIHTNIVQTYHLGSTGQVYFIAMELIRGANLEQFMQQLTDKHRPLPYSLTPVPGNKKGTLKFQGARGNQNRLLGVEDSVLGSLGDAEFDDALGRNLNLFTGGGVASDTGFAVHQHELAKAGKGERVLGVPVSQLRDMLENLHRLLLGDLGFDGNFCCHLRFGECFCHN